MRGVQRQEPAVGESDPPELSAHHRSIATHGARARAFVSSMRAAWLRAAAVMAVCCCVLGAGATQAGAAPTWLAPHDLSESGRNASVPEVAVNPSGEAIAVWQRTNGEDLIVQAASRPAGGEWSEPQSLSESGQDAIDAQVAIDPEGNAVAVWQRYDGSNEIVQAATRPAGGEWSKPQSLSETGRDSVEPQVAIGPKGEAIVTWEAEEEGSNWTVQATTHPVGGEWSKPQNLSETEQNAYISPVAVDSHGDAIAVWQGYEGGNWVIEAAMRPAGGEWSKPQSLSEAGQNAREPHVAVTPEGDATVVWYRSNGSYTIIQAATRPTGGEWSEPQNLSEAEQNAGQPRVAVDSHGYAVAAWQSADSSNAIIQAATRPAGGEWSKPQSLSEAGQNATEPDVAVDPEGNAIAVWSRSNGSKMVVQAASQAAGGEWSEPQSLSEAEQNAGQPRVAVDSQGDGVAVWHRNNGTNWIIQAAGYDAAGPQLRSLAIPEAGKTGQSLSFSVSPLDVWSALGQTSWSFGDGTSATGTSVTHAYAKAGTYQVTLTGQDALGNTSTATGTITITAPAPEPKPTPSPEELPVPLPEPVGKAFAAHLVHVKGKIALVRLHCRGKGRCHGVVKLIDRIQVKRVVKRHGHRKTIKHTKRVIIGKASFTITAGKTKTIKVKLTAKGRKQLRKARHHRLKAHIAGHDVKHRAVILTASRSHRKRASGSRHRRS